MSCIDSNFLGFSNHNCYPDWFWPAWVILMVLLIGYQVYLGWRDRK